MVTTHTDESCMLFTDHMNRSREDIALVVTAQPCGVIHIVDRDTVDRKALLSRLAGAASSPVAGLSDAVAGAVGEVVHDAVNTLVARTSHLLAFCDVNAQHASKR